MQKTWVAKRVLVEWMDIAVLTNTEDELKPVQAYTVGWVEVDAKDYITLLTTRYKDLSFSDKISIPKGCITLIKKI